MFSLFFLNRCLTNSMENQLVSVSFRTTGMETTTTVTCFMSSLDFNPFGFIFGSTQSPSDKIQFANCPLSFSRVLCRVLCRVFSASSELYF